MLAFYCYLGIKLHVVYLLSLCAMSWHNAKIDCNQRKAFLHELSLDRGGTGYERCRRPETV